VLKPHAIYCDALYLTVMKRNYILFLLLGLAALPAFCALRARYETGKIVAVEQKTRTRVLYYLVNTAVEKEEPYYEISVQVGDMIYTGEYSPRHATDSPPDDWTPGASVEAKIDKHYVFIKRPYEDDLRLLTSRHVPAPTPINQQDTRTAKPADAKP
jgi:hypothetical protein